METKYHLGQQPKNNISKIAEGLNDQSFFYGSEQLVSELPKTMTDFIMKRMMRVE